MCKTEGVGWRAEGGGTGGIALYPYSVKRISRRM